MTSENNLYVEKNKAEVSKNVPELRFQGFIDAWEQRKLNEVSDIYDGTHQTPKYQDDGVMFLSVENIKTLTSNKFISREAFEDEFKIRPQRGDVLMTRIGDIGTANVVETDEDLAYYVSLALFKSEELNPYFLQASIYAPFVQDQIWRRTLHIAFPKKINKNEIGQVPINVPTLAEQTKIGSFFKQLDDTITLHQRKLDNLKRLKQGYLQRLFPQNGEKVPRLRFTNFERDWKLCEVGNSAFLRGRIGFRGYKRTDLVPPHQGAITFSPSDIDNDGNLTIDDNDYISLDKYYESPEIKVKSGDILFTKTASIGKIAYVHELKEKATINPQFALLTPNKTVDNYFLFQSLRHPDFLKKVKGITGGSSVQTMSQEKLKDLVFFVPALDEQIKVSDLLLNLNRRILLQQSKLANLKSIKQALLQKMFI